MSLNTHFVGMSKLNSAVDFEHLKGPFGNTNRIVFLMEMLNITITTA